MSNGLDLSPPIIQPPPWVQIVPQYGVDLVPDIDFAQKDPAIIASEVISSYQDAFKALTGIAKILAPGDPVRLHLLAVCAWLSQQRVVIDFTGKMNLLKYAHDAYLDNLAALYGDRAIRLSASAATCTLQFTLATPLAFDALIPQGTLCQAGSEVFITDTNCVIAAGQTTNTVTATCQDTGSVGNGYLPGQVNYIMNWNQQWVPTVTNLDTTAGGGDTETDDQYRYRVWLAIESFSIAGPHDAYEFWALSADPSIIQAVVYSAPNIAGEVWIYPLIKDAAGIPQPATPEICQKVLAMCSAKTRRPVADYVSVFPPTEVAYTVNVDYWVLSSNEVLLPSIQQNVTDAVMAWILWERSYVSRDINGDELIKRCLEAGAKRIVINQPTTNFHTMAYNQLATCDTSLTANVIINYQGLEDA